ncbi:hypothetical protein PC116_g625 [Phytophthora cactorum]|uniref:Uncharacterized protein n=1 Tax=Phytophthora cactorum TaxID=29920 RepID=A0A8T1A0H8_9STRA|nr:hypothetical protein PC113_g242 [Phytophthora cactorum]KAG3000733.1 hypothetical protein PC118_g135 [Phytophthora cactorum]KAG3101973.1 hypothetical protein PC121_g1320 [Phytophthora cactorum]KAG3106472.1 hypothetical protein PC122_g445 [Phytophthora cactorum]KAG3150545.1 hypothetical protein C6341_g16783 [Phytophthora cactorum]
MEATVPVKRDAVMQKAPALLSPAARRIGDIGAGRLIPAGMGYEHLGYAESIYRHSFEEKVSEEAGIVEVRRCEGS